MKNEKKSKTMENVVGAGIGGAIGSAISSYQFNGYVNWLSVGVYSAIITLTVVIWQIIRIKKSHKKDSEK